MHQRKDMTQDMKIDMILHTIGKRLVCNGRTHVRLGAHYSSLTGALRTMLMLLMLTLGTETAWGEITDGLYYIKIGDVYVWRAITEKTSGQPYLSGLKATSFNQTFNNVTIAGVTYNGTYSFNSAHCTWVIKQVENTSFYTLINVGTNQYVVWDTYTSGTAKAVHLETKSTEPTNSNEKCFYSIYKDGNNYYIHPDQCTNNNTLGFNYKGDLRNTDLLRMRDTNGRGLIQFYTGTACTIPQAPLLSAPTISDVDMVTNKVTVTDNNNLPPGYKVRYTFSSDGTPPEDPTASSAEMPSDGLEISVRGILKVVIERYDVVLTEVQTKNVKPANQCDPPIIVRGDHVFTITCSYPTSDVKIYYTTDDEITAEELAESPTTKGRLYHEGGESFTDYGFTVKAVATADGYITSEVAAQWIGEPLSGEGTESTPYLIASEGDFSTFVANANASGGVSDAHYKLMADIDMADVIGATEISEPFTGTFDGNIHVISNLRHSLFNSLEGAKVKNVILDNVKINGSDNKGAIANEASGDSRIYNCGVLATGSDVVTDDDGYTEIANCSSTICGTGSVGGIVGLLKGTSRVINCFSYANITGGNLVGGIVGENEVATTAAVDNQKTMVMNCMFYGDITGGTSKAPIYNGLIITNDGDENGVNNFNYFWAGASYVQDRIINVYNCALSAETRFLQRFEFFRHLLNSNRELAAWWASTSSVTVTKNEIMKWVLEPSQIGTSTPYPILRTPGKYYSVVNYTQGEDVYDEDLILTDEGDEGVLHVKIQMGDGAVYHRPFEGTADAATITTTSLDLPITDKDPDHFNFNYGKVQLPYYNDVGTKNYTDNKVVTGWKIVAISGTGSGTHTFSTGSLPADVPADATATADESTGEISLTTPYNFADRKCTQKDLYGTGGSNRIFNQGAYWDVPEGVTAITIEPYWGKAVYLSDAYWDVTYQNNGTDAMNTAANVTTVGGGQHYDNGVSTFNGQLVYTSMGNAIASSGSALFSGVNANSHTVYDYAVVLVGNYHHNANLEASNSKPYTVTSVDLDGDNEPDYSYILRFNSRIRVHPVRIDFLNAIGLGMAQKPNGGTGTYNFGIMQPKGWFESTNTSVFRLTQFEYDPYDSKTNGSARTISPMILQGGVIEQWVTIGGAEDRYQEAKSVSYYHVGSNVWFKEFHIGVHQDKNTYDAQKNPNPDQFVSAHPPISVTGGDFDEFYLTGLYNTPNNNYPDNAECYINGGRFGKVAGTGMQGLGNAGGAAAEEGPTETGNIIWQIDNADIDEFYAGGYNAAHISEGNIFTVISNSRVDQFCGGPKFGNMNSDKRVVTNASNCTFRTFFGAGYGGNSYNRRYPYNKDNIVNLTGNNSWNSWVSGEEGLQYRYSSDYGGVETRIDYQFIPRSNNTANVARLFVDYVSFSLATTYGVTSILTDCTITTKELGRLDLSYQCLGNFYGGGSLGKVVGEVKSTLTNCTVEGNVFGAGYSASLPKVKVMDNRFRIEPYYDENLGAYLEAGLPATTDYTWEHADEIGIDTGDSKRLFTTEDLSKSSLGSINGDVTLTLDGDTTVGTDDDPDTGHVYGGGQESYVTGEDHTVTVNILGNTEVLGDVFGGGDEGDVEGKTLVNIGEEPTP